MFARPGFQSPVFSGPSCVRVILDDEGVGVEVFIFWCIRRCEFHERDQGKVGSWFEMRSVVGLIIRLTAEYRDQHSRVSEVADS